MNAFSKRQRRLLLWMPLLVLLVFCIGVGVFGTRKSAAQRLMQKLEATARDGCPVETLLESVGEPDEIISGDQAPTWLVETTANNYPDGVRPTDTFLVYRRTHSDKSSCIQYLQVRDGRLVNVDSEFPDPDTVKTHQLF